MAAEAGGANDAAAVEFLLRQRDGDFEFTPGPSRVPARCRVRIGQALMNAMRARDEGSR